MTDYITTCSEEKIEGEIYYPVDFDETETQIDVMFEETY